MKFKIRDAGPEVVEEEIELWIEKDPIDQGIFFKARHSNGRVINICTILTKNMEVIFSIEAVLGDFGLTRRIY